MWWRAWPDANVGVRTGNGLLVIDIDPRNHGDESWRALETEHGIQLPTPTVNTGGGGVHLYLAVDRRVECKTNLWPGIDIKGDGGYVIAPPSIHVSGAFYDWSLGRNLDDLSRQAPQPWLLGAIDGRTLPSEKNARVVVGERNSHLMSVGGRARRVGADEKQTLEALQLENAVACSPPLDAAELARIAGSVCRYPTGSGVGNVTEILKASGVTKLTNESPVTDREAAIDLLKIAVAPLDRVRRSLLREELIKRSGFSADLADAIVRQTTADGPGQKGSAMLFKEPLPWTEPVDTAQLLDEILQVIVSYVVLLASNAVAIAVWILHTHALDAAQISPRLAIISPEKRCGKSTLLKLLGALVRRPLEATNITAAVLFRSIEAHRPTLLVDEADTFLRDRDDLRGVLNAGHDRQSAKVPRCVGDDHEPRVFDVWAPVAFAGIGKQHDTLMDRSIVISMKRRSPASEPVASFRRKQREALGDLHRKLVRWARDNGEHLANLEDDPPLGLDDRAADNWEPLFAIALLAGATWRERVRAAALSLSGIERGPEVGTHGELLLGDIRGIFADRKVAAISAKSLLDDLLAMAERPWPEANGGDPLSPRQLGIRLARFGVHSRTVRGGSDTARSYVKTDFDDAFSRYLTPLTVPSGTSAELNRNLKDPEPSRLVRVTDAVVPQNAQDFADVTDVTDAEEAYAVVERAAIQDFDS